MIYVALTKKVLRTHLFFANHTLKMRKPLFKKMKFFLLATLMFSLYEVSAQNIVLNGSFESQRKYFKKKKKLKNGVKSLRGNIKCFNAPNSELGHQLPYNGNSYCGLILTSDYPNECSVRDYIQLKLSEPLKAGYKYLFSLQINLANNSGYYTDQIGVSFSEKDLSKKRAGLLEFIGKPSITNDNNDFLRDTLEWVEFKEVYNATGGEQFIIIGNFQECNRSSRKALTTNKGAGVLKNMKQNYLAKQNNGASLQTIKKLAYYFIDNISMEQLETNDSITYLSVVSACTINKPISENNAENLIQDSGFDLNKNRLNNIWKNASKGTPDFVDGYTGLYLYSDSEENNREYIISPLKQKLSPCNKYYFSFKIRRNSVYKFAVDNIGISLVDTFYRQNNRMIFPLKQDFHSPKFNVINNTKKWITMCGEVVPSNCSKYIVIGNFKSDKETYIIPTESSKQGGPYAHYFIDDVEIYKSDTIANCFLLCNPKPETLLKQGAEITKETLLFDTLTIKFEKSSSIIKSIEIDLISKLKKKLSKNESLSIVIDGHTDSSGKESSNLLLSKKRAFNFYKLLVEKGIDKKRINYNYYGEKFPIADNSTENGKKLNRRIDIYFTEK